MQYVLLFLSIAGKFRLVSNFTKLQAAHSYALLLLVIFQARFCTSVLVEELSDVCRCRAEILEPKKLSQDNFTKFVSSLALSVHVSAALYSVTLGNKIAVQVLLLT